MNPTPHIDRPSRLKPCFWLNHYGKKNYKLPAAEKLEYVDESIWSNHYGYLRQPLGIYNASTQRICSRLISSCSHIEGFFSPENVSNLGGDSSARLTSIADYMELCLHSVAEHIDDVNSIARGFYKSADESKSCMHFEKLSAEIKESKKYLVAVINAIKHKQFRLRLYSQVYIHEGTEIELLGYFIEGAYKGGIGAHPLFHGPNKKIFSITSLLWEVIYFTLFSSFSLASFLSNKVCGLYTANYKPSNESEFINAVCAVSRLPLYSIDDDHPFNRADISLRLDEVTSEKLHSQIYGSIKYPWAVCEDKDKGIFGKGSAHYKGDNSTTKFEILEASGVTLIRWKFYGDSQIVGTIR